MLLRNYRGEIDVNIDLGVYVWKEEDFYIGVISLFLYMIYGNSYSGADNDAMTIFMLLPF